MIRWIKQHKPLALVIADAAFVVLWIGSKLLSDYLLAHTNNVCDWTRLGAECLTCGGTHFASAFFGFDWIAAFQYNQLLFFTAIYLLLSYAIVHLMVFCRWEFTKTMLKWMYNIPVLIVYLSSLALFLIVRNWYFWPRLARIIWHIITTYI